MGRGFAMVMVLLVGAPVGTIIAYTEINLFLIIFWLSCCLIAGIIGYST